MKSDAIIGAVEGVTKKWSKQRKREERERAAIANRRNVMTRRYHVSIKEAAWRCMEEAYLKASANGTLPAHARQIMYAARPYIQRTADREISSDFDKYFTQQLLPDFIEEHGVGWNVVFDARGHFREPHTDEEVPLGTLHVRDYLSRIGKHSVQQSDFSIIEKRYPTLGPENCFGAILFVEKEGFMPLFDEVKLAERYDVAIMSTKGMSVTASRELVDVLGGNHQIPLLVLHDFDKSGFSIVGTLMRDTRRYSFTRDRKVIDLGLRLDDIDGLETEDVYYRESPSAMEANLSLNGATDDEIEFLQTQRVELNALASDELVELIERKLQENGVAKVIPDEDTLADAYRRMRQQVIVQQRINEVLEEFEDGGDELPVPDDLRARIQEKVEDRCSQRWDEILKDLIEGDLDGDEA